MGNQEELTHDSLGGDCQDRYDSSDESKSREKSSRKRRKANRTCRLKQRVASSPRAGNWLQEDNRREFNPASHITALSEQGNRSLTTKQGKMTLKP